MDAKKTGALIAKLRTEKKMTQTDLAEKLGVTNKAISRWETGRGYPDIEMLPELARVLDISVQELLDGEVRRPEQEDRSLQYVCNYAGQQRRRGDIWKILLVVLFTLRLLSWAVPAVIEFYFSIVGSDECVIASDYSSLVFRGDEYLPLPLNGYECVPGEMIVEEARVDGVGLFGKLFFGDGIYTVQNVLDYELIYLSTDMDVLVSDVYVLKSKYGEYEQLLAQSEFDGYFLSCRDRSGYLKEYPISEEFVEKIFVADEASVVSDLEGQIWAGDIYLYEEKRIFRRLFCEIDKLDDQYYWLPSEYWVDWGKFPGYYVVYYKHYPVDKGFNDELSKYIQNVQE